MSTQLLQVMAYSVPLLNNLLLRLSQKSAALLAFKNAQRPQ